MALDRSAILAAAQNVKTREVDVPELGGSVFVRGLSSKEWDAHQASTRIYDGLEQVGIDEGNITARLMVRCIVDEDGKRILEDSDAPAFGDLPIAVVNKVAEAVFDLSGMTEKAQAETEGNSGAAPSGETSSE